MYKALLIILGTVFAVLFFAIVFPPAIESGDIIYAFGQGFVNPYSTGYSLDVFFCYAVLAVWIIYERQTKGIRYGWVCLVIAVVPGVATGFALYLLMRERAKLS